MIQIKVKYQGEQIEYVSINGHAGYDEYGKDIVCAAVSSIVITSINAMIRVDDASIQYQDNDGKVELSILKHDSMIDLLVVNMIDLLKELKQNYREYIEFK